MIARFFGVILGIVSLLIMLIALVPMLGWLNWVNIPIATIGLIFSSIGNSGGGKTMNSIAIIFGILRLIFGGGIV